MDRLQAMVTAIVRRAKKTLSPTQAKQLTDMTQDVKTHLNRLQAKHLQLQGQYIEQSKAIKNMANKGSTDIARFQEIISREIAKIALPKTTGHMPR